MGADEYLRQVVTSGQATASNFGGKVNNRREVTILRTNFSNFL